MSNIYNYLRDGGMVLRIKPIVTTCNTVKTFPTFEVALKHLLTIVNGSGTNKYTESELIEIIAGSVVGNYFDHWDDGSTGIVTDPDSGVTTVTMPFFDCTVTAVFLPYRQLNVNSGDGDSTTLKPTDVQVITADPPNTGYAFHEWSGDVAYVTNVNSSITTVTMPDADVTITATYTWSGYDGSYGYLYNWYTGQNQAIVEFGYLYNWWAGTDIRNIANTGWHMSTRAEWNTLITYLGGNAVAGGKMKETGTVYWESPNVGATNESGFNGRGGGWRDDGTGVFSMTKAVCFFHVSDYTGNESNLYLAKLEASSTDATCGGWIETKKGAAYIRLVKDSTILTNGQTGTYIGNDGRTYRTICIDSQEWLAEGLMESKFRNGDIIPFAGSNGINYSPSEWMALTTVARCSYNNAESYVGVNNQITSSDDWIIPSDDNWTTLTTYLGSNAADKLRETGTDHWSDPNAGTNEVGFNLRGAGYRTSYFTSQKAYTYLLSSTEASVVCWMRAVSYNSSTVGRYTESKSAGYSIRLVKNSTGLTHGQSGTYTGNDGKIYPTICIGTQEWLAQNLGETKYRNGNDIPTVTDQTAWAALTTGGKCAYNNDEANV